MFEFANSEKINTTLRESLQSHAGYLSAVEDYRHAMVLVLSDRISPKQMFSLVFFKIQRIENQILLPMVKYSEIMKQKRVRPQKNFDLIVEKSFSRFSAKRQQSGQQTR